LFVFSLCERVQARVVRKGEPPVVVLRWCLLEPGI
jgi:hypothetical protein